LGADHVHFPPQVDETARFLSLTRSTRYRWGACHKGFAGGSIANRSV
jgi:hypothetical protein